MINPLFETVATSELPPVYVNAPLLSDVGGVIVILGSATSVPDNLSLVSVSQSKLILFIVLNCI